MQPIQCLVVWSPAQHDKDAYYQHTTARGQRNLTMLRGTTSPLPPNTPPSLEAYEDKQVQRKVLTG